MKKQIFTAVATAISLFGIYWIGAGKTSLKPTGEVGWQNESINYTQPPGWVFSIWGLIYLGFLAYALYGLFGRRREDELMERTTGLVGISILLNLAWVAIAGAQWLPAAYVLQWGLLALAIAILLRFRLRDRPDRWARVLSIPFGLYAGWLTVAMIPFTAELLNGTGWRGEPLTQPAWGCILYVVAVGLVLLVYRRLRQPFYLLPLAWALFGFTQRFDDYVRWVAAALCVGLTVYAVVEIVRTYRGTRPEPAPRR